MSSALKQYVYITASFAVCHFAVISDSYAEMLSPSSLNPKSAQVRVFSSYDEDRIYEYMQKKEDKKKHSLGHSYASKLLEQTDDLPSSLNPSNIALNEEILSKKLEPSISEKPNEKSFLFGHIDSLRETIDDLMFVKRRENHRDQNVHIVASSLISASDVSSDLTIIEHNSTKPETGNLINPKSSKNTDRIQGIVLVPYENFITHKNVSDYYDRFKSLNQKIIVAAGISDINARVLENHVKKHLGQKISVSSVDALVTTLKAAIRDSNQPYATVFVPEQRVRNGIIFLVVRQAIISKVEIAETKYFSEEQIRKDLHLKPGMTIKKDVLEQDVEWLNRHPNRKINVDFSEGDITNSTNMSVNVEEQKVWRTFGRLSNDGVDDLDKEQYIAGLSHNNLWGYGHQFFYQYGSSLNNDSLKTHALLYSLPLPWRHILSLSGTHSQANAEILNGAFDSSGTYKQLGLKYDIPIYGRWAVSGADIHTQTLSLGYDYKESEGSVLFTLFGDPIETGIESNMAISNFLFGYDARIDDKFQGVSNFQINAIVSPGEIGGKNTVAAFTEAREDTDPAYWYLKSSVERTSSLELAENLQPFEILAHIHGQYSPSRLIGTERMMSGMQKGFRGYSPDALSGDYGYGAALDLSTPPWVMNTGGIPSKAKASLFIDTGFVGNVSPLEDEEDYARTLSTGVTFDYYIRDNVAASLTFAHDLSGKSEDQLRQVGFSLLMNY